MSGVGGVCLQVSCLVVPACIASRRARVLQLPYTINYTPSHSNLLYKATVIIIIWFDWRDRAELYELRTGKIRWWEKLWDDILFCKTRFRSNLPWLWIFLIQPSPWFLWPPEPIIILGFLFYSNLSSTNLLFKQLSTWWCHDFFFKQCWSVTGLLLPDQKWK